MEKDTVIGLDLAKNVFQVHGNDAQGKKRFGKKLKRSEVLEYFAQLPLAKVGMEACCGAHEWARQIQALRPLHNRHEQAKDKAHGTEEPEFT